VRILIISSGLKPERFGGLPSHVEDVLRSLVKAGEEVAYLNVGAKSKWPATHLCKRNDLPCLAWNLSSKIAYAQYWNGTMDPEEQIIAYPAYRRAFFSVIDQFKPDMVHIHELTGFPVELVDDLRSRLIRIVFSAHDFYLLCPTVKLFRPDHSFCARMTEQLDCHACSSSARSLRALQWGYANEHWFGKFIRIRNLGRRLIWAIEQYFRKPAAPRRYIDRRLRFERLFRDVDVILATSRAQQRIFEERTTGWSIRFLQLSRSTICPDRPTPRLNSKTPGKLVLEDFPSVMM
jgi:hypothetical protein